jgi:hypothetical protein
MNPFIVPEAFLVGVLLGAWSVLAIQRCVQRYLERVAAKD